MIKTRQEMFEKELNLLDDKHKEFVSKSLDILPEYFFHIPASSTGKYHPSSNLGEGGLLRHTKAAVLWANTLLNLRENNRLIDKNIVISALILHDGFKNGEEDNHKTMLIHPTLCADKLLEFWKDKNLDESIHLNRILNCIKSHMGQWCTSDDEPNIMLPIPNTSEEKFVHLCDYIASRKFSDVKFDEEGEIIE